VAGPLNQPGRPPQAEAAAGVVGDEDEAGSAGADVVGFATGVVAGEVGADELCAVGAVVGLVVAEGFPLGFGAFFLSALACLALSLLLFLFLSFASVDDVAELVTVASVVSSVFFACAFVWLGDGEEVADVPAVSGAPSVARTTPPATKPAAAATPSDRAITRGEIDPIGMGRVFPRSADVHSSTSNGLGS
jgi:hypothetical protein